MVDLRPCPFCGGEASADGHIRYWNPLADATWADGSEINEAFYVNCMPCGAVSRSGVSGGYQTRELAITAWNRRALETELCGHLKWAESVLKCWIEGSAQLEAIRAALAKALPTDLAQEPSV